MKAKKFPQITRKIPALVVGWLGLLTLIGLNLYTTTNLKPVFWDALTTSLAFPTSDTFTNLAKTFWQLDFTLAARKQLLLAQDLSAVLGANTEVDDILQDWDNEPKKVFTAYNFWRQFTNQYPNSRDGQLNLAANAYRLNKLNEARVAAQIAINLDPGSAIGQKLIDLLGPMP